MKIFKWSLVFVMLTLIVCIIGLCIWLCNPWDNTAWRLPLRLPLVGVTQVRALPLIQLTTSTPGLRLLNHTQWHSKHGLIQLENKAGLVQLSCANCHFNLRGLSAKAIVFDHINLSIRRIDHQLTGMLETQSEGKFTRVLYTAQIHMQGVDLAWSLPSTAITDLLVPLKSHSETIQKAHVTGTLSATGTLHWPSRIWSAKPVILGFDVTGLGTEKLKTAELKFQCPQPNEKANNAATASQVWLDKKGLGRWLPMAVMIAEDAQFMHHDGYDIDTLSYLLAQEKPNKQLGGSTISQQLAKYFFTGGERQWKRKIEELLYAVEMESTLGKNRILNLYLNTVDWGPSICGAYDAAQFYFAVKPSQLTAVQAAWLAGIIRSPHRAWQDQYLTNKPDFTRIQTIMRYMPARVRALPVQLNFTQPNKR
ncbi:MAG: biosynthetic peptidoglycan transglycosylase [Methylophilus sp.]|nr:biosynthetic peptidoglycan transglycosylase [Methylophilus sp.]